MASVDTGNATGENGHAINRGISRVRGRLDIALSWQRLLCAVMLACASEIHAQEALSSILDRGHVASWIVCGPFESLTVEALEYGGEDPLGKDRLASLGGQAAVRPRHMLEVPGTPGQVVWQDAGSKSSSLDLGPYFEGKSQGLAYAAFYATSAEEQMVFVDLQSPLGSRVYLNGTLIADFERGAIRQGGSDRLLATFRKGTNLFVAALPGAAQSRLAGAARLGEGQLVERDELRGLRGRSGYEFSLRLARTVNAGDLVMSTRLQDASTFSMRSSQILQDVFINLFNPTAHPLEDIVIEVPGPAGNPTIDYKIDVIPPNTSLRYKIGTPHVSANEEALAEVEVKLLDSAALISTTLPVHPLPETGTVYVQPYPEPSEQFGVNQSDDVERNVERLSNDVALMMREPNYGFSLGGVETWRAFLSLNSPLLPTIIDAMERSQVAPYSGYGVIDERLVSGETLIRNLQYGHTASRALLGDANRAFSAWNAPTISPQLPQILAGMNYFGVVSNLADGELPTLFRSVGINGESISHRHLSESLNAVSYATLALQADRQRGPARALGVPYDIAVARYDSTGPRSLWLDVASEGRNGIPKLVVSGASETRYWEDVSHIIESGPSRIPERGLAMTRYEPGALLTRSSLKRALFAAEQTALTAEKLATFAGLLGAAYPDRALDLAWRQIFHSAHPERVGFSSSSAVHFESLGAVREALSIGRAVRDNSVDFIAEMVDTYSGAPNRDASSGAVVVFNPSSWSRTDIASLIVLQNVGEGLTLLDDKGVRISFVFDNLQTNLSGTGTGLIHFVATDLPSMGYRTYYLQREGPLPREEMSEGLSIRNEFYTVEVDASRGGVIHRVLDNVTGEELTRGEWNDLVAFPEDAASTGGGRELWTRGTAQRASARAASVKKQVSAIGESLVVEVPFLGGTATTLISLHTKVKRIGIEVSLREVDASNLLLAAKFETGSATLAPLYGERFGTVVGTKATKGEELRSESSGPHHALQPFLRWAALSKNDSIQIDRDRSIAMGPTRIVYGDDLSLRSAARALQGSLLKRGIPADVYSAQEAVDARQEEAWQGLYVALGGTHYNSFVSTVFDNAGAAQREKWEESLSARGRLMINQTTTSPVLILGGMDLGDIVEASAALSKSLSRTGNFQVEAFDLSVEDDVSRSSAGLAVLTRGPGVMLSDDSGTMHLLLEHGQIWDEGEQLVPEKRDYSFTYALYPLKDSWRSESLPRAAHAYAEPLVATTTGLHLGGYPAEHSFVEVGASSFVVTSVRPELQPVPNMSTDRSNPREGFVVQGYETLGEPADVAMNFFSPLMNAARVDLLGETLDTLTSSDGAFRLGVEPFEIVNVALRPSSRIRRGVSKDLTDGITLDAPAYTRYWRHHRGAPASGFQPISLHVINSDLAGGQALTVRITNHLREGVVDGFVSLQAGVGWQVTPQRFDYSLGAGEYQEQSVVLLSPSDSRPPRALAVETAYDGQRYRDVLSDEEGILQVAATREGSAISLSIKNTSGISAAGYVEILSDPNDWPELGAKEEASGPVPRATISIPPHDVREVSLYLGAGDRVPWVVIKVAANGVVLYKTVQEDGATAF